MLAVKKVVDAASIALAAVAGVLIVVMMLNVVADIIGKYFFRQPINGTIEIVSWYYMVAVAFLPVAYVQVRRQHLMVELFTMKMAPRGRAALDGIVAVAGTIYSGLLTWLLCLDAITATARNDVVSVGFYDMVVWPPKWVPAISFGLLTLVFVFHAMRDLWLALTGRDILPEPPRGNAMMENA